MADTPTPTSAPADRWGDGISQQDREALAALPNGAIGRAFYPPSRLAEVRWTVRFMADACAAMGLGPAEQGAVLLHVARASSIPEGLLITIWNQQS